MRGRPRGKGGKRFFKGKPRDSKRIKKETDDDFFSQRHLALPEESLGQGWQPPIAVNPSGNYDQLLQTFGIQKEPENESEQEEQGSVDSDSNADSDSGEETDELAMHSPDDLKAVSESSEDSNSTEGEIDSEESSEDSGEENEESIEESDEEGSGGDMSSHIPGQPESLSPLQQDILDTLKTKRDFYYPEKTPEKAEEIRTAYCLHIVNHVLKAKSITEENDRKLKQGNASQYDCRDQGFTSAKVLILVPHRQEAANIMMAFCSLLFPPGEANLAQSERFISEFYSDEDQQKKKGGSRKDFDETFAGNIDDCFQIGVKISREEIQPYAGFYEADIIIASPFGLRQSSKKEAYDYLSSLEIVVVDQANVLYMQNWKHVIAVMLSLHKQPKEMHKANITRIHLYAVNGKSKEHSQLVVFSAVPHPTIHALFRKFRSSLAGQVNKVDKEQPGVLGLIHGSVTHMFHRFEAGSITDIPEARFQTFITDVLPWYKERNMHHVLMLIPSSFDYIRIRNYFGKMDIPCAKVSENCNEKDLWKEKTAFYEGTAEIMLLTERYYFYTRSKIKSVQHLIFYEPPFHPHFYRELCGMAQKAGSEMGNQVMCTTLYCKYDGTPLANLAGLETVKSIMQSKQQRYTVQKKK